MNLAEILSISKTILLLTFSFNPCPTLGLLVAFDKGIGGGGYGPIVTSGQIVTGIDAKSAIGIMSLTEGIVSIMSVIMYILIGQA